MQTFLIRGHSDGAGSSYNIKFFETPSYPYGLHRLKVIHQGNGQSTPLNLVSLLAQNGTLPSSGGAITPGDSTTSSSKPTIAPIIGGAVAGAVVLVLAILLFVMLRRRMKSKNKPEIVDPITPEPYLYNPISQVPPSTEKYSGSRMASQSPPTILTYGSITNRHVPSSSYGVDVQPSEHSSDSISHSLPYLQRDGSPRRPRKAQETEAESPATISSAQIPQSLHSGGTFSDSHLSSTSGGGPILGPARIVVHQDSGLRLQSSTEAPVIDIPPQYTPG